MAQSKKQFLVDENGEKTAVLLPIKEYEALMGNIQDLAITADPRDEPRKRMDAVKGRLDLKAVRRDVSIDRNAPLENDFQCNEYTAVIKQDGGWWIGWIEEVPGVNCQEATRDELLETLKITLKEILEINKAESLAFAGGDFQTKRIVV